MDYKSCFKKKKTEPKPVPSTSTKSVSPDAEIKDKNGGIYEISSQVVSDEFLN